MKCIVVDDIPVARLGMQRLIATRNELELVGSFDNAVDALAAIKSTPVDLIFLDIRMPGISGLDLAKLIPEETAVIFTTAYTDYAVESYDLNALDYLVKPIDPERFNRGVDKALSYKEGNESRKQMHPAATPDRFITVKSDRRYMRVLIDNILYVEGNKDLVIFKLADGKRITTRATLKSIEDILPPDKFLRINKSYIINRDHITAFDHNDIIIGEFELSIGATYRDSVLALLLPSYPL